MPYWIACEINMLKLQNTVTKAIDYQGFKPAGGIFLNRDSGYYLQALWKPAVRTSATDIMEIP